MPRRAFIVAGYPDPSRTGSAAILPCGEAVRETLFGMVAAASNPREMDQANAWTG